MAFLIYHHFEKLNLSYPAVTETQKQELEKAKHQLMNEQAGKKGKTATREKATVSG